MINLSNVSKIYKDGTHALNKINLHIDKGEFIYITGKTGSGKSTLIKLLDAEELPTRGNVLVAGIKLEKLKRSKIPMYRRNLGVVFQDYRLLKDKTVYENIAFALEVVDVKDKEIKTRVNKVLELVGLKEKIRSYPNELSGGQQQRVALARAIVNNPSILIADEPTGNLDPITSQEVISLFEKINEETNTTILIVTHDTEIIKTHPKRCIELLDGMIINDYKPVSKLEVEL